jgi:mycothiol S-conjugate amidase
LLAVHAHPDDEASKGAATVARYHADGVRTVLVCCTGGEMGDLQNPALRELGQPFHGLTPEQERAKLSEVRPLELARSAEIIGYDRVHMLGYRDSGMLGEPSNDDPESFHQAPIDEAVGRLVAVMRDERPDVVLTYGDDHGGYPHPDHVRVHEISVLAWERAADPSWYPEAGEPFQPRKLYYVAWANARIVAIHDALLRLRGSSIYGEEWLQRGLTPEQVTTRIDGSGFLAARTGALLAHASQVDPTEGFWFALDDAELAETYPWDDFVLARSLVGLPPAGEMEHDLFAGIRSSADASSRARS